MTQFSADVDVGNLAHHLHIPAAKLFVYILLDDMFSNIVDGKDVGAIQTIEQRCFREHFVYVSVAWPLAKYYLDRLICVPIASVAAESVQLALDQIGVWLRDHQGMITIVPQS